jgi:hypothetical protein
MERSFTKRVAGLLGATVLAASLLLAGTGAASAAGTGSVMAHKTTVWVVHGVPGVKVDVCVNGAEVRSNFAYGQKFSAMLPAGTYHVVLRAAKAGTCTGAAVLRATASVKVGRSYTAVAGLTAAGAPKLFWFGSNLAATRTGNARLLVRHTAGAPAVDVWVNGLPFLHNLANGGQKALQVPAGTYLVAVSPHASRSVVIGPAKLTLAKGFVYQVYATGTAKAGFRLQVIVQRTK